MPRHAHAIDLAPMRWSSCLALVVGLLLPPGVEAAEPAQPPRLSETVVVDGAVRTRLALHMADLEKYPPSEIATVSLHGGPNAAEAAASERGVKLTALLQQAGLDSADRDAWKHTVVSAWGADGYRVVFSWPELFETTVGDDVVVAFARDGKPLDEHEGRIALASTSDRRPARNVKWLTRLEVRILKD